MMTPRRFLQVTSISCSLITALVILPRIALGDDPAAAPTNEIDNSRFQFEGRVNANSVYVRSGASDNDYPTMKLDSGAIVAAVGVKFDWLKIIPPEGSFCYVATAYVEKRGDGSVGRVTSQLNVRVGSSLNALKTKVSAKLEPGTDVTIIGEQDEYFKIKPPADVYLYVNKQFVDPVRQVADAHALVKEAPKSDSAGPTTAPGGTDIASSGEGFIPSDGSAPTTAPSTQPAVAEVPSTQPSDSQLAREQEILFDQLEAQVVQVDKQPLEQQPLGELLTSYQKLASSTVLPESMRRMSEYRVKVIQSRLDDQQRFVAVKTMQDEMKSKQVALQAEREELEQRIKATGVQYFTAVGTLRVSSLQGGTGGTLYRLTDPASGRTVVYLR
jgi:hypothetical protein